MNVNKFKTPIECHFLSKNIFYDKMDLSLIFVWRMNVFVKLNIFRRLRKRSVPVSKISVVSIFWLIRGNVVSFMRSQNHPSCVFFIFLFAAPWYTLYHCKWSNFTPKILPAILVFSVTWHLTMATSMTGFELWIA